MHLLMYMCMCVCVYLYMYMPNIYGCPLKQSAMRPQKPGGLQTKQISKRGLKPGMARRGDVAMPLLRLLVRGMS